MWQMVLVILLSSLPSDLTGMELQFHSSQAGWQSSQKYNTHHLPHIYILPPDDGLLMHLKHAEVW
jgi:hypothetical protein